MATKKLPESTKDELRLAIDNGDLNALDKIIAKFGFKDEVSVIRFALGLLLSADEKEVQIKQNGQTTIISPHVSLLNSTDTDPEPEQPIPITNL